MVSRGIQMLGTLSREGKQLLYLGHRNLTFGPTWPQGSSDPELGPADLSLSGQSPWWHGFPTASPQGPLLLGTRDLWANAEEWAQRKDNWKSRARRKEKTENLQLLKEKWKSPLRSLFWHCPDRMNLNI